MELIEEAGIGSLNFYDLNGNIIVKLSQLGLANMVPTAPTYTEYSLIKLNSTNYYASTLLTIRGAAISGFQANSTSTYNSTLDNYTVLMDSGATRTSLWWLQANDSSDSAVIAADGTFVKSGTAPTALTSADVGLYLVYNSLAWYNGGSPSIRNTAYYILVVNDGSGNIFVSKAESPSSDSRSPSNVPVSGFIIPIEAW